MNPDFLPALGASLRALGEFAARHEVDDATLAEISAELGRAGAAVAGARGERRANRCVRHPGGPVDPTVSNGCLLCGSSERRPAAQPPADVEPGEVLNFLQEHGHEGATARYGPRAVTRAVVIFRHPSNQQSGRQAGLDHEDESEK
ncbi:MULTISPECIES: hypothetical protein [unclassified Streptomyces]|uniref:hypothetical protein n=1 Tax=unclassified Streptomyces TaxID=2593676 RepID=UPI002024FA18|nr:MULTISPECIES: hypothetical protein [unclassified Streptomyces]MCX4550546.1 hypothetical protein [Streptomyces sp. NBC_01500]WSC21993.1 hypothetical protein OIE60_21195 [Streptomyces sp. NBC_01766]